MRPTRVVIDLIKLENNIKEIKSQLDSKTAIMAIVKANAYGHGILEVAKAALKSGAHSLGVAIPEEGVKLRRGGIDCDILVLGGFATDQINLILDYNLSICLFSLDSAMLINKLAGEKRKKVKVHLKVDTGTVSYTHLDVYKRQLLGFDSRIEGSGSRSMQGRFSSPSSLHD